MIILYCWNSALTLTSRNALPWTNQKKKWVLHVPSFFFPSLYSNCEDRPKSKRDSISLFCLSQNESISWKHLARQSILPHWKSVPISLYAMFWSKVHKLLSKSPELNLGSRPKLTSHYGITSICLQQWIKCVKTLVRTSWIHFFCFASSSIQFEHTFTKFCIANTTSHTFCLEDWRRRSVTMEDALREDALTVQQ